DLLAQRKTPVWLRHCCCCTLYYYILIPLHAATILVGQAVSPGVSSSDVHSGGASPLWTVMTGTIRLGKGARREAGSEES
ncbi:MAG TPA: hypothetical protein VK818_14515, partial [Methylomirabilota bacterium]|nr:hypothetical protein [Methylomirabilota bacterium]